MRNLFKTTVAAVAGVTLGLLFAKKSGKQLRTKLAKSETPFKDLVEELKGVANNSKEFATEKVKNSEDLKKIADAGKSEIAKLKDISKDLGAKAEAKVDSLLNKAKEALKEAKEVVEEASEDVMEDLQEKAEEMKDKAKKTVRKFKNEVKKK